MSAIAVSRPTRTDRTGPRAAWRLMWATARIYVLRWASNPLMMIQAPLQPILILLGFYLVYSISGQNVIPEQNVVGFLVIGLLATDAWSSTVWGSGWALQDSMYSGTIATIIASPGSTAAIILGYGLGSFLWGITGVGSAIVTGLILGAEFDVAHPVAALVSLATIYISALGIGLGFGALFILSRHANALSNFLQTPIYLLAGFFVPRELLPDWVQPIANVIPLAHAIDALRATALDGQSFTDVASSLLYALGTGALFVLAGIWGLSKMDRAVRRNGTLDLL